MPRAVYKQSSAKVFAIVLVAVLAAGGYAIYSLYAETQEQSRAILEQAQTILQKSQQITGLEGKVANQSATISNQSSQILNLKINLRELGEQVANLGGKLGLASKELEELTPKIRGYYVVGVKSDGSGVVVPIEVKIVKGDGAISANINKVELLSGTQDSIRTAASVASSYTGLPISGKDITVSFVNQGDDIVIVDGGSAGSAITATMIATLLDKKPDTSVLMTGTISSNGAVGPVGSVEAKARAAMGFGAQTFLVPPGQAVAVPGIFVISVSTIDEVVGKVL